ncbi:retrovirus-related pol polyprotein from transposon TNT 1-94 [Tanacetum coccineum]|uniref:Retrovirus-related pol polyprotein from transposon TNT 1-94 n=1 Tax=Tanacetum coccineum TaxID=301880 RepID=A0ABQ5AWW0_9ASTR
MVKNKKGRSDKGKSDNDCDGLVNLENESLKDDISELKKVIEKWTSSKVTIDQRLSEQDYLKRPVWYLDSSCSRYVIGVKQYLHRYSKESGPKVVFGDNSSSDTKGYGSVNCNGITFTKTQGTIFNQNDEVILIAPRRRDVYVIDMSSYNEGSNTCFFAKASPGVNWLWHKRLSYLNFNNINNLAKHNLVSGLPSLTFSKYKYCTACENGKHHKATFKTKRSFSIDKSLHLLHMDLFGPVKPKTISHNKYTLVIVDKYSSYSPVAKAFRVFNIRRQEMEEIFMLPSVKMRKQYPNPALMMMPEDIVSGPPVPQDRWSRKKHIDLVNIISKPLASITTRSRVKDLEAAIAHECSYVNYLNKIEPKKLIEPLEEEGWIIAMQEELN